MKEKEIELKTKLAASIFASLAEHRGTSIIEYLVRDTIDITNKIYKGINE